MNLTFAPDGTLQIEDARIIYRNFSGVGDMYNREGDRHFTLVIPDSQTAEALTNEGWTVKIRAPKVEGEEPFMTMKVKVNFTDWGPRVYLVSGKKMHKLDETNVGRLDKIMIASVDMDIRPYDWSRPDGRSGRSAYLKSIKVIQRTDDRFADEYERAQAYEDGEGELPF